MSRRNPRPLTNNLLTKPFVEGVLELTNPAEVAQAASLIMQAEIHAAAMEATPTLDYKEYRSTQYCEDGARTELREKILLELLEQPRLENDDDIRLGHGGALPKTPIQRNKQAFFVTGLPASGKSGIANRIADAYGAVVLDSDYAKRKFPEFEQGPFAASVLHAESTVVVLGDERAEVVNLKGYCLSEGYNVVMPMIGYDDTKLKELAKFFKKRGYTVHLTLVSLDRQQATLRAYRRFLETKRYVPLSLIFDVYGDKPDLAYLRLKADRRSGFASFGEVSTANPVPLVKTAGRNNPAVLFR